MGGRNRKKELISSAEELYKMQLKYLMEEATSYTEDFDSRACSWCENEDAAAQNFEHIYKTLALFHLYKTKTQDTQKGMESIVYLATHQKHCDCNVMFPGYITAITLMLAERIPESDAKWRPRLLQAVRMSRNQTYRMCSGVRECLETRYYHVIEGGSPDNTGYFFPSTGVLPMSLAYLKRVTELVQRVFPDDQQLVVVCNTIGDQVATKKF